MLLFLGGIAFLIVGYFTYGSIVERIFGFDDRPTPGNGGQPWGLVSGGLPVWLSVLIGGAVAYLFAWFVIRRGRMR